MKPYLTALLISFFTFFSALNGQVVETVTGELDASGGVSVDGNGNIYVADFGDRLNSANGSKIYQVSPSGDVEEFASGFQGASGNAFDSNWNLYQSNIAGNYVSKITPDGEVSTFASSNIWGPVGIAVDKEDNVYVANCGTNEIMKVTPSGQISFIAGGPLFLCPNGLTIDDDGNLYTCNFGNGDVIKIDTDRNVEVFATIPGDGNGHLTYANGRLYVVARCANQIYEVTLDGEVTLLAGTGQSGNKDGDALSATFNLPNGIEASPNGDTLYVNDAVSASRGCRATPLNPVVVRRIILPVTDVAGEIANGVADYKLNQNYPNPFNPSTKISYSIKKSSHVVISVFNSLGEKITTLAEGIKTPGTYVASWNGTDSNGIEVPSGIYFYSMQAGDFYQTNKMLLLK